MSAPSFDLQSHSLHSDGKLSPEAVVGAAVDAGVELLALTDHDTVDGVAAAASASADLGIRLVPATELSAVHDGYQDLHILGYLIDPRDSVLRTRLADARADRVRRADAMAARLRELGFEVEDRVLELQRASGGAVGRPHLASAVVTHPSNADRLLAEGAASVETFIPAYLVPMRPAYLPRTYPSVQEAIGWIHDAGGVAVWAHPFWDVSDPAVVLALIDVFRALGLDGVECFYPTHTAHQTHLLAARCTQLDMLTTGSADFHGPKHRLFDRFRAFDLHGCTPRLGPIGKG